MVRLFTFYFSALCLIPDGKCVTQCSVLWRRFFSCALCRFIGQWQPPVLKPHLSKVDGLAFIGLSLSRKSDRGHPDSVTHQTAFDLNDIIDRDYEYLSSTNDDGWLVGGGEPGAPKSYKLAAKDSAHVEIMRIGTYKPEWGGISEKEVVE